MGVTSQLHAPGKVIRYPLDRSLGARARQDAVAKRKYFCPYWESNPGLPAPSPVTLLPELSRSTKVVFGHVLFNIISSNELCISVFKKLQPWYQEP
jgi:hypothetical protein